MRILGIESSCDDTGVAIVEDGTRVLCNLISSQVEIHRPYGGVVPEIASRAHIENLYPLVERALQECGIGHDDIDAVAVTHTPGLAGCLLVGLSFAKAYAYASNKPFVGVHHLEAHAYTIALNREIDEHPPFPHLSLLVSGGHTALYRVDGWTELHYLGGTKDDAAGEAFDKVAKALGLGFPGGPLVQKAAADYDGEWIDFPRPLLHQGYDFSFSGLKTAVVNHVQKHTMDKAETIRTAASFQFAAIDVLVKKTIKAAKLEGLEHITLVGGVSANEPLRQLLRSEAEKKDLTVYLPDKQFSVDNGAMVAGIAYHYLQEGRTSDLSLNAKP